MCMIRAVGVIKVNESMVSGSWGLRMQCLGLEHSLIDGLQVEV